MLPFSYSHPLRQTIFWRGLLGTSLLLFLITAMPALAQDDDARDLERLARLPEGHTPKRAVNRALLVPGWGQIYNRQYWKTPIVYGGMGTVAGFAIHFSSQHRLHTRAFQWKGWQEEVEAGRVETHPYPEFEDEYLQIVALYSTGGADIPASRIKPLRDNFRRNRDLSLFGIGLVYGIAVLDAYISAHLLHFDVSEDLTFQVVPAGDGMRAAVSFSF